MPDKKVPLSASSSRKSRQISLVPFLAACILPGVLFGIIALVLAMAQVGTIQRTASITNNEYLPSFMDRQRVLLNIEKLRRYVEIIYSAESQTVRRTSSINAIALASESIFAAQNGFAEYAPIVFSQIRGLTDARNRSQDSSERLYEYELRFRDAVAQVALMSKMPHVPIYPHSTTFGVTPRERHLFENFREQTEISLRPLLAICKEKSGSTDAADAKFLSNCSQTSRYWDALGEEWQTRLTIELESRDTWRKLDDILRGLSDTAYTAESVLTYRAVSSIENDAKSLKWITYIGIAGIVFMFVLFIVLAYHYLVKPLVLVARGLLEIRYGRELGTSPDVLIKEYQHLISQLPYLKKHLEDLNARSGKLAEEKNKYESLSYMDGLTGVGNRRNFDHQLASESPQSALSILLLDVDLFKNYNDTLGHQAGDVALIAVAKAMKQALLRSTDRAFRYGGEEFAVILSDAAEESAMAVAARILITIRSLNLPHPASSVAPILTASIGVASREAGEELDYDELVARADKALYRAKSSGRNRICVFQHGDMFTNKNLPSSDEIKILQ